MPDSTLNLLVSGLMGIFGGLIAIPLHAIVALRLKRTELLLQDKLLRRAKREEMLLQHDLEMKRKVKDDELAELKAAITRLGKRLDSELADLKAAVARLEEGK